MGKRSIAPLEAALELTQRKLARLNVCEFGEYVYDWYHAYEMHKLIGEALQDVLLYLKTDGAQGTPRLIILTPPQHGKSELISRIFPAFALGQIPDLRVFLISYGADLATENSKAVRNLVLSSPYQAAFGTRSSLEEPILLSSDSRSSSSWDLAQPHRGGVLASGINGAISGRAKGLAIIDDPIKNHKEAQSQGVRDDAWEFWLSSIRPRAKAAVLVMTHWHPDDPAGRFLKQMVLKPKADQWKVLMLPGLAFDAGEYASNEAEQRKRMLDGVYVPMRDPLGRNAGEVLCSAMLTKDEMLKTKETDEFYFTALYQQMPYAKEGQRYKREWFKTVAKIPEGAQIQYVIWFWDKAASLTGDFTAGVCMAYCSNGYFYILDVVRGRWSSFDRDQKMREAAKETINICRRAVGIADPEATNSGMSPSWAVWHQQDPGSAGLDSAQSTNRALMGYPTFFETVTGDKATRSQPLESAFQGGMIFLLQGAWNDAFIEECAAFDRGQYDDQVDSASSAYNKLIELIDQPIAIDEIVTFEERVSISPM